MRQDIQIFSNITDINTADQLRVELTVVHRGRTVDIININGKRVLRDHASVSLDLFSTINLKVTLLDFDEGLSGVEIKSFKVNGLDVLPKYQHISSSQNNYIDKLGTWTFEIPSPFYVWYHQISGQGFIA